MTSNRSALTRDRLSANADAASCNQYISSLAFEPRASPGDHQTSGIASTAWSRRSPPISHRSSPAVKTTLSRDARRARATRDSRATTGDGEISEKMAQNDGVFEEFRHVGGALVRADDAGASAAMGSLDDPSRSSPPWMQRNANATTTGKRKRAGSARDADDDSFLADDDEDLSADEDESEMSDRSDTDASDSSLGSASGEETNGLRAYADDFSTNPVASSFKAPTLPKPNPAPSLKFSMKAPRAARAPVVASEDEASLSGSTTEEDEDERSETSELGARKQSET